ncbi:MAG: stage V sporulation protein AE [Clostridia bacterium]|nr:stage V sporulation protein AE [Clostridia bacterium]
MAERRKIIVVTDGDKNARRAVEVAAKNIGARCITASEGNPTPLSGPEMVNLIKTAQHEPVVVMVDDRGSCRKGAGERVLEYLGENPDIEIIGAVAVASNDPVAEGVEVDFSVSREGELVRGPVNKQGQPEGDGRALLEGDTVDVLRKLGVPVIVGTGDTGKMDGADSFRDGAPITTRAFQEILRRSRE